MGMTMDYVGFADRTIRPVKGRMKTRSKSDWAWHPYHHGVGVANCGSIKVYRPNAAGILTRVRTLKAGRPVREVRG